MKKFLATVLCAVFVMGQVPGFAQEQIQITLYVNDREPVVVNVDEERSWVMPYTEIASLLGYQTRFDPELDLVISEKENDIISFALPLSETVDITRNRNGQLETKPVYGLSVQDERTYISFWSVDETFGCWSDYQWTDSGRAYYFYDRDFIKSILIEGMPNLTAVFKGDIEIPEACKGTLNLDGDFRFHSKNFGVTLTAAALGSLRYQATPGAFYAAGELTSEGLANLFKLAPVFLPGDFANVFMKDFDFTKPLPYEFYSDETGSYFRSDFLAALAAGNEIPYSLLSRMDDLGFQTLKDRLTGKWIKIPENAWQFIPAAADPRDEMLDRLTVMTLDWAGNKGYEAVLRYIDFCNALLGEAYLTVTDQEDGTQTRTYNLDDADLKELMEAYEIFDDPEIFEKFWRVFHFRATLSAVWGETGQFSLTVDGGFSNFPNDWNVDFFTSEYSLDITGTLEPGSQEISAPAEADILLLDNLLNELHEAYPETDYAG